MDKDKILNYTDSDLRSIAETTCDNGFLYDLRDQGADDEFAFFESKRLGFVFEDDDKEYHYCLDDGMLYVYNESENPCMSTVGLPLDELKSSLSKEDCPTRYGSVSEAMTTSKLANVYHRTDQIVTYNGYKLDIDDVRRVINTQNINILQVELVNDRPIRRISVYVHPEDITPADARTSGKELHVMNKETFEDLYDGEYDHYLMCQMAAAVYFAYCPKANNGMVYAIAKWKSGLYDDYKRLNLAPPNYSPMYTIQKMYDDGGYQKLRDVVVDTANDPHGAIRDVVKAFGQTQVREAYSHDWSASGLAKLARRVKMAGRKGKYRANQTGNKVEKAIDIHSENPFKDTGDGSKVNSGSLLATNAKVAGAIPKPKLPTGPAKPSINVGVPKAAPAAEASQLDDNCDYLDLGDSIMMLGEAVDPSYNRMLYRTLYEDRMRKTGDVLAIYKRVKEENPWIKYTFISPYKYRFNLFVDTYFYNQTFFANNSFTNEKATYVYAELLKRLIGDARFAEAGFTKQTIFFNVLDWCSTKEKMWMYRIDFNPISIIYRLMAVSPALLKDIFGDRDVVFCGPSNYFKINFSKEHKGDMKMNFVRLIKRLISIGEEGRPDPDPVDEPTGDSTRAIALDIVDKLEKSQNIKINNMVPKKSEYMNPKGLDAKVTDIQHPERGHAIEPAPPDAAKKFVEPKALTGQVPKDAKEDKKKADEATKDQLVNSIVTAASSSNSTDEAIDKMDSDHVAKLIAAVAASEEENNVINKARASRMNELNRKFLEKEVKGKSVKDMLNSPSKSVDIKNQIKETELPVSSINEEWKHMKYMNFDKGYNVDGSILAILNNMANWTYPIAIRDIEVKDNSTSEDYLDLWVVQCEDSFGKRFQLKFDVPKFVNDNRYMMLRGNLKTIETQFFLMPILKTDEDMAQIVTNYNKIIIKKHNTTPGKSCVEADYILKILKRYHGNKIKVAYGDNTKVCSKYTLPMDYIDLAQILSKIETPNKIWYFDQDEIREKYADKMQKYGNGRTPIGVNKSNGDLIFIDDGSYGRSIEQIYWSLMEIPEVHDDIAPHLTRSSKYTYARASILNSKIPVVLLCGYAEGLTKTLDKMQITYNLREKLDRVLKQDTYNDWIKFSDGYLTYTNTSAASLLLNGLKECDTENWSVGDINSKSMYIDFLDDFCERVKLDGLDNFYDCLIDPITKDVLEFYDLPTDYVGCLVYATALLADSDFIKHTDTKGRRIRRAELVAGYVYKAITNSYADYTQGIKHSRNSIPMSMKQSAVVDLILLDPTEKDYSTNNMLTDVESVNAISTKGLSGLNSERAYSLDKRTYDESMLNIVGMSTGFAGNVGITRQATMDMNVEGERGYVVGINGDSSKLSDVKTLTATEALTPMGVTHDDPFRTAMTFVQKSKHAMRCVDGDPLLVTNGSDEALPYISSDIFAHKAKGKGKVTELVPDDYMIIEYSDGTPSEYVDLSYTVQKNSDGGFYIPLQLTTDLKVGSTVREGDIVAYDPLSIGNTLGETDSMAYKVGTLAKIAILQTDEGFEDSAIMSKRLSDAMTCDVIKVREVTLSKDTNIYDVMKKGTRIEEGDIMMSYQTPYESEDLQILQRNLAGDEEELSSLGRRPVKAECTGVLTEIRIYRTCEVDELSPSLKKLVTAYEKPIRAKKKALEAKGIPTHTLPPTYKLPATGKLKHCEDGVFIEFCQQYRDVPAAGDKIVWYSANKGVDKELFPEGLEPYTDLRPNEVIDGYITNTSINGRMVCCIEHVAALNKLMVELDRTCKDMLGIPYDDSVV